MEIMVPGWLVALVLAHLAYMVVVIAQRLHRHLPMPSFLWLGMLASAAASVGTLLDWSTVVSVGLAGGMFCSTRLAREDDEDPAPPSAC